MQLPSVSTYLAPAALPFLPWILLGLVLSFGGTYIAGHHNGYKAADTACDAAKAESHVTASNAIAQAISKATVSLTRAAAVLAEWTAAEKEVVVQTQTITKEVTRVVHDTPALNVPDAVPADVVRLRDDQVRSSAAILSRARERIGQRARVGAGVGGGPPVALGGRSADLGLYQPWQLPALPGLAGRTGGDHLLTDRPGRDHPEKG